MDRLEQLLELARKLPDDIVAYAAPEAAGAPRLLVVCLAGERAQIFARILRPLIVMSEIPPPQPAPPGESAT